MEVHVCFENCVRGLFITLEKNANWITTEGATRIEPELENKILEEYKQANFGPVNDEISIAKTSNFLFRKQIEDDRIWVEPIDEKLNNTIIE